MTVEAKIKELLERAMPMAAGQEPRMKQGSSVIDQHGTDDVEDLGSEEMGVVAAEKASATGLPVGQKAGSGEPVIKQGSSENVDPDEEDLSADGDRSPGVAAAKHAAPTGLPVGQKVGSGEPIMKQGSSDEVTPGQGGTPKYAEGNCESAEADLTKVLSEAGISEDSQKVLKDAFEKVVVARVERELELASDTLAEAVQDLAAVNSQELYESVNEYLNYAVETWMEKNELAVEQGLRVEISESFISGLKDLFETHAIDIPEEKYDALKEATKKIEELEAKLNETLASTVKLSEEKRTLERRQIVERAVKDMVSTDAEKFTKLVEEVEFESSESFAEKIKTMKERYFTKNSDSKAPLSESVDSTSPADEVISSYVSALSKTGKHK